jgi:hypothetical protein
MEYCIVRARSSKELTLSLRMLTIMNGIVQMLVVVLENQQIRFVMPKAIAIACKLRQES